MASIEDPLFDPSTCKYRLSQQIRDDVARIIKDEKADEETRNIINEIMDDDETNKNLLDYNAIAKLHKYMQWADKKFTEPFYMFKDKCKCIIPKPRDNKILDIRLKHYQQKSSQALYNSMTASVDGQVRRSLTDNVKGNINNDTIGNTQKEFKDLYGSVVAVFNSFLVFICTFFFCYKALEYALPVPNYVAQVLFGILGSLVVAVAEIYFLMRVV